MNRNHLSSGIASHRSQNAPGSRARKRRKCGPMNKRYTSFSHTIEPPSAQQAAMIVQDITKSIAPGMEIGEDDVEKIQENMKMFVMASSSWWAAGEHRIQEGEWSSLWSAFQDCLHACHVFLDPDVREQCAEAQIDLGRKVRIVEILFDGIKTVVLSQKKYDCILESLVYLNKIQPRCFIVDHVHGDSWQMWVMSTSLELVDALEQSGKPEFAGVIFDCCLDFAERAWKQNKEIVMNNLLVKLYSLLEYKSLGENECLRMHAQLGDFFLEKSIVSMQKNDFVLALEEIQKATSHLQEASGRNLPENMSKMEFAKVWRSRALLSLGRHHECLDQIRALKLDELIDNDHECFSELQFTACIIKSEVLSFLGEHDDAFKFQQDALGFLSGNRTGSSESNRIEEWMGSFIKCLAHTDDTYARHVEETFVSFLKICGDDQKVQFAKFVELLEEWMKKHESQEHVPSLFLRILGNDTVRSLLQHDRTVMLHCLAMFQRLAGICFMKSNVQQSIMFLQACQLLCCPGPRKQWLHILVACLSLYSSDGHDELAEVTLASAANLGRMPVLGTLAQALLAIEKHDGSLSAVAAQISPQDHEYWTYESLAALAEITRFPHAEELRPCVRALRSNIAMQFRPVTLEEVIEKIIALLEELEGSKDGTEKVSNTVTANGMDSSCVLKEIARTVQTMQIYFQSADGSYSEKSCASFEYLLTLGKDVAVHWISQTLYGHSKELLSSLHEVAVHMYNFIPETLTGKRASARTASLVLLLELANCQTKEEQEEDGIAPLSSSETVRLIEECLMEHDDSNLKSTLSVIKARQYANQGDVHNLVSTVLHEFAPLLHHGNPGEHAVLEYLGNEIVGLFCKHNFKKRLATGTVPLLRTAQHLLHMCPLLLHDHGTGVENSSGEGNSACRAAEVLDALQRTKFLQSNATKIVLRDEDDDLSSVTRSKGDADSEAREVSKKESSNSFGKDSWQQWLRRLISKQN